MQHTWKASLSQTGFLHPESIDELDSLSVILASGAAFVLIKKIAERSFFSSPNVRTALRRLAITFGIYLLQVIVKEVLLDWTRIVQTDFFTANALWNIPLSSVVVLLISFFIVHLLQKIPLVNYIVP